MFYLILSSCAAFAVGYLYSTGQIQQVQETIVDKYQRFKTLNKVVATQYKGIATILYHSVSIVVASWWFSFTQWINNSVKKLDNKRYEVKYVINGKTHKMIVRPKKGPRSVLLIYDENNSDCSELIFSYFGPEENFHGTIMTPETFGKKSLTFEYSDGRNVTFKENEQLTI